MEKKHIVILVDEIKRTDNSKQALVAYVLTCTGVNAKLDVNPEVAPLLPYCFSLNLMHSGQQQKF